MTDAREERRWQRLESLWDAASNLPADRRAAFLDSAVSDDAEMRRELESMLNERAAAERFFGRIAGTVVLPPSGPIDAPDRLAGTSIGPYRVEERLGAGGMGIVHRALDRRLDRVVALKLLPPHLSIDERARRRFFTEARAAAAIDHPNVCTIYEIGETTEPRPFLAMAYYAGESLERVLENGPLPPERAVHLAAQIARGLEAAHARGITHRDIKPGNIMITADGVAKILDFGLATLPDAVTTRGDRTLGTVAYMSPERARGLPSDHRTDLWSLGVVLYEMVTGARPFRADSEVGVLFAIAHEPHIPPSALRPDLPLWVECVIDGLLEKDPAQRFADATCAAEALEAHAPDPGAPVRHARSVPRRTTRSHPRRAYVGVALALVAAVPVLRWMHATGPGAPRVAVIVHDDTPPGDGLGWLAGEAAGTALATLGGMPGIEVVPMSAIRPWRNAGLSDRDLADRIGADWLVAASVRRASMHVVTSVTLMDVASERLLARREPARPLGDEGALIEDLARIAGALVREQLLTDLQAGRRTWSDTSPEALRLVHAALGEIDEADRLFAGPDAASAWPVLRRAEATLQQAARADPDWAEPLIRGARLADRTARFAFGTGQPSDSVEAVLERGIRLATHALAVPGDSGRALEARGILRHTSTLLLGRPEPARRAAALDSAEQDLRAAVRSDRGLALALSTLGSIEAATGRSAAALITMEDAYRADRYERPIEKLTDLFEAYFQAGQDRAAEEKCVETGSRFPASWIGARCRLRLMAWGEGVVADPDSALGWAERGTQVAEETLRAGARMQLHILAAAVLARAGLADSAHAVLRRTRDVASPLTPQDSLVALRLEAGVHLLLGDAVRAGTLLGEYLERRPTARAEIARSREFAGLFDGLTSR